MSSAKNPQPGRRKAPSGAARSQRDWRHPLRSWFGSHRDSARQALVRVRHYPFSSAMTVLVMTIALALPMGLSVLIGQVKQLGVNWQEAAQISVYLADDVSAEKQQSLTEQIRQLAGVAQAQLLDKDLALAEVQPCLNFV